MLALCIEASHARGMGHLYRSLVLAEALVAAGRDCLFLVNDDPTACGILSQRKHRFEIVHLHGDEPWEAGVVASQAINLWVNDRHITGAAHAARVKALGIPLVTFDDRGPGSAEADLHIAAMIVDPRERVSGRQILRGFDYLILNPEISLFRRLRTAAGPTLVTLGGSDTYGATVKVVKALAAAGRPATVVVGPAFRYHKELANAATPDFIIKNTVPSLIEEFSRHALAITGGGVTPLEACASGLPCIVVANEDFEVPIGTELERLGAARFAGHHAKLDTDLLSSFLPIEEMSRNGLAAFSLNGVDRVVGALLAL